jgi:hypothetical protein
MMRDKLFLMPQDGDVQLLIAICPSDVVPWTKRGCLMITQSPAEAISDRLFGAMLQTWDVAATFLGARLGYYAALADLGEATPRQLAARTGTNERYTREWLEQQAATGLIEVATA